MLTVAAREARARRALAKAGEHLKKSRARTTHADDEGGYMIINNTGNYVVAGPRFDMTLEQVEAYVRE